jgi:hypothetical protein
MVFSAKRAVLGAAVVVAALGAFPVTAGAASAAPARAALNCNAHWIQTSLNEGMSIDCTGGWFRGGIWCERNDNHYQYQHLGQYVASGRVSTVWCDRDAKVVSWFADPL